MIIINESNYNINNYNKLNCNYIYSKYNTTKTTTITILLIMTSSKRNIITRLTIVVYRHQIDKDK